MKMKNYMYINTATSSNYSFITATNLNSAPFFSKNNTKTIPKILWIT